jgi:outer membrane usher protein
LQDRIVAIDVTVNGAKQGTWTFVERQNELYASRDAFEEWRLLIATGSEPITVRGQPYWPLSRVAGFAMKVNPTTQSADLTFSPDAFFATRLSTSLNLPKPDPVLPSVFVNYDVNLQTSMARDRPTQQDLGVVLEGGVSTGAGVLTTTYAGRNIAHSGDSGSSWVRLETTYNIKFQNQAVALKIGDAATRQGLWGSTVYFGGFQVGSDYSLQPGFLTQPVPIFSGVSAAPSTVQLYVNDVLRKTSDVAPGPFVIDNLGGVAGAGEARLVVRDVLGRETVIVQRYFTSAQLLASGLSDWSVEAGAVRKDLGLRSASYGQGFASATWRRGLTDSWTVEGRGEATAAGSTVGLGAIAGLPFDLLARGALSVSRYDGIGSGHRVTTGIERQWSAASLFFQAQLATRAYRELGSAGAASRFEWTANSALELGRGARLGLGFTEIFPFDTPRTRTASASLQFPLLGRSTIVATYSRVMGLTSGSFFGASVTIPLDNILSMQAAATARKGGADAYVSVSQSSSGDTDFGWRALGGTLQSKEHSELGMFYGGRYGRVYSDISASPGLTTLRTGASGSVIWAANRFFASRRLDQSFAVVEINGYDNIGVGLGYNTVTKTDSKGIALIPNLSAYQANQVRLDAQDIPLSADLESLERAIVPSWRSGVKVEFAVRAGRAALLRIQLDDGEPAPAGAILQIEGDGQEFYVARRGEAYLTGLQPGAFVRLSWQGRSCRFPVELPAAANDEIGRIGPLRCAGLQR